MLEVREGGVGRLALLFERHHRPLFSFFYRMTSDRVESEDLVQDVFFRLLKYRDTYQPRTSFAAWMYQIARNAHIDQYRRKRPETPWVPEWPEPASSEPAADAKLHKRHEIRLVQQALRALPVEKREVLVLSRYQDLKYEEIGRILGCEAGAVKLRVFRAVRALGEKFRELSGEQA